MTKRNPFNFSVFYGGPERDIPWKARLDELYEAFQQIQTEEEDVFTVALLFDVPGSEVQPQFEGVRIGRYWGKDRLLAVDIALPSTAPDDPRVYLIDSLGAALRLVAEWAEVRHLEEELSPHRAIVEALSRQRR